MRRLCHYHGAALVALCLLLGAAEALAKTPICVVLKGAKTPDAQGYRQLAFNEVRRHPHHTPVASKCEKTLHVEYIPMGEVIFLTAYFDGQVPAREKLTKGQSLEAVLKKVIALALGSDPGALIKDTARYLDAVLKSDAGLAKWVMMYGMEAYQLMAWVGSRTAFAPGIAMRIRREVGSISIGARVAAAFSLTSGKKDSPADLTLLTSLEPEFMWYATPNALSSFYIGGTLGMGVIRFKGYPTPDNAETATDVWVTVGARMGFEFMRASHYRVDIFAQANAPLDITQSDDGVMVDNYTPWVQLGAGVSF